MDLSDITTARLSLVLVPPEVLADVASAQRLGRAAGGFTGGDGPSVAWAGVGTIEPELVRTLPAGRRMAQLAEDETAAPWLVRAIVVDPATSPTGQAIVGHLGGHGPPDADGMVEIGYTVAAGARGGGIATAAARAWFAWAHDHGARVGRLSTTPDNMASRAIASRLGLVEIGALWDDDDACWELVHEGPLPPPDPA